MKKVLSLTLALALLLLCLGTCVFAEEIKPSPDKPDDPVIDPGVTSPKTESVETTGFQWNKGSITGACMVVFGIGIIVFGVADAKKKKQAK